MESWRDYLPAAWLEIIDRDEVLTEAFGAHEFPDDSEPVAPYLFQDLRFGNCEQMRSIFALYGPPGLEMLRGLLENPFEPCFVLWKLGWELRVTAPDRVVLLG